MTALNEKDYLLDPLNIAWRNTMEKFPFCNKAKCCHDIKRVFALKKRSLTLNWTLSIQQLIARQWHCYSLRASYELGNKEVSFVGYGKNPFRAAKAYEEMVRAFTRQRRQVFREKCFSLTRYEKTVFAKRLMKIWLEDKIADELVDIHIERYVQMHSLQMYLV